MRFRVEELRDGGKPRASKGSGRRGRQTIRREAAAVDGERRYRDRRSKVEKPSGYGVPTVTILAWVPTWVTERVTRPVVSQAAAATSPLAVQLTIPRFLAARHDSAGGLRRSGHQDLHELADQCAEHAATRARWSSDYTDVVRLA